MDPATSRLSRRIAQRCGNRTIACAESFTAGGIAQALAAGEGASEWFRGGVVAYQTATKRALLGVTAPEVVSEPAAREMASGVARLLDAAIGISTTGVAGPEPADGIAAGTVVIGWCVDGETGAETIRLPGDPTEVVRRGTHAALERLDALLDPVLLGERQGDP